MERDVLEIVRRSFSRLFGGIRLWGKCELAVCNDVEDVEDDDEQLTSREDEGRKGKWRIRAN